VHPQQCGYLRFKDRTQRRPELPQVPAVLFYPQFAFETLVKYTKFGLYALKLHRMRKRLEKDPAIKAFRDLATTPVVDAEHEHLAMFELNASSRAAVDKARRQADERRARNEPAPRVPLEAAE
jgi:hypothetical protein